MYLTMWLTILLSFGKVWRYRLDNVRMLEAAPNGTFWMKLKDQNADRNVDNKGKTHDISSENEYSIVQYSAGETGLETCMLHSGRELVYSSSVSFDFVRDWIEGSGLINFVEKILRQSSIQAVAYILLLIFRHVGAGGFT